MWSKAERAAALEQLWVAVTVIGLQYKLSPDLNLLDYNVFHDHQFEHGSVHIFLS